MATETHPDPVQQGRPSAREPGGLWQIQTVLRPVASLKLTVVLFAMAIFITFTGTLAQAQKDIWDVIGQYFRTPVAWIDLNVFFPRSFFPSWPAYLPDLRESRISFPFPGGWLIGLVMAINLVAAHTVRFKIRAGGTRLLIGLVVTAIGVLVTWLVIAFGHSENLQASPLFSWTMLWSFFVSSLVGIWLVVAGAFLYLAVWQTSRIVEQIVLGAVMLVLGLVLAWLFWAGDKAYLGDSGMRILWQLTQGWIAGAVLLVGCVLLFRQRAGIVLLHLGIGLMMLGELLVGLLAKEGQMYIAEGQTANYVQDVQTLELAVLDTRSDNEMDQVTVIPESLLLENKNSDYAKVQHKDLPFDVQVLEFYKNSSVRKARPHDHPLATEGKGLKWVPVEIKPGTGADSGGEVDQAAAYVRFTRKDSNDELGTYLLSQVMLPKHLDRKIPGTIRFEETVSVDGNHYEIALRFKRTYKPYSMRLVDVRADYYRSSTKVRSYSSDIRLVDRTRDTDRDVKIRMNDPLRFAGETFYQSTYHSLDPDTGTEATGLQVVTNFGWMIPYVGCMIVVTGLLAQFMTVLLRFLRRADFRAASTSSVHQAAKEGDDIAEVADPHHDNSKQSADSRSPKNKRRGRDHKDLAHGPTRKLGGVGRYIVPMASVAFVGSLLLMFARPPSPESGDMDIFEFSRLPVMDDARVKPFDTLARNSLKVISDRETFIDHTRGRQPAIRWLLDMIARPSEAAKHQVVRIDNLEVLATLKLEPRKGFRYAVAEIKDEMAEFEKQVQFAHRTATKDASQLSTFQKKLIELDRRLRLYMKLGTAFDQPQIRPEQATQDLLKIIQFQREDLPKIGPPLAVPPATPGGEWESYTVAWTKAWAQTHIMQGKPNPATLSLNAIFVSYAEGDANTFNEEVSKYRKTLERNPPNDLKAKHTIIGDFIAGRYGTFYRFESAFNHFAPFFHCSLVYIITFTIAVTGWLLWPFGLNGTFNRSAFALIALTFVVHSLALVARMYISGRPPVTNLYSSAVFIGWVGVSLGMVLEWMFRLGIGNVVSSVAGFSTLVIAHKLGGDGDTVAVLQPVLDTQFWLATHVVCITFGYATTFVAGLLGVIYVLARVGTPMLSVQVGPWTVGKILATMIYGVVCFALFFSFFGTVLGGLWADDSWGRFWGWDPKENGALIIVLWNALVLHARRAGLVKQRGLAVLAIGGNIVTSWSWFGVNELGVGLHSYGFTEGVLLTLGIFVASQLLLICLGMSPARLFSSVPHDATR